jgi:hypothetical protein
MNFVENTLMPIWQEIFDQKLTDSVENAFSSIKTMWNDILMPALTGITDFLTGIFTQDTQRAMNGIANIFVGGANMVIFALESMVNMAISAINGIIAAVNSVSGKLGIGEIATIDHISLGRVELDTSAIDYANENGEDIDFFDMFKVKENPSFYKDSSSSYTSGTAADMNILPKASMMASGGVLKRGQIGLLEGSGAEAVVPLEHNKGWISRVAQDMNASLGGSETNDLLARLLAAIENMDESMTGKFTDALQAMRFDVSGREFGRLVREYA